MCNTVKILVLFNTIAWIRTNHLGTLNVTVFLGGCWQINLEENPLHCVCNSANSLSLCATFEKVFITMFFSLFHGSTYTSDRDGWAGTPPQLFSRLLPCESHKSPWRRTSWHADRNILNFPWPHQKQEQTAVNMCCCSHLGSLHTFSSAQEWR